MHSLLCYGDSNTWGYDPRSYLGECYADSWCSLLAAQTRVNIVNLGKNGQRIPYRTREFEILDLILQRYPRSSAILIMLGTNDVLSGISNTEITERMDGFLQLLKQNHPDFLPILIAPPPIKLPEFSDPVQELAKDYSRLAEKHRLPFLNPQLWNLKLAYDGIHLTEADHKVMASQVLSLLAQLYPTEFTL